MKLENPLLEYLGVELSEWGRGNCEFHLDVQARHLNRQSSLQGGVIATLLDAACGYAGLKADSEGPPDHAVTVMLAISYVAKVDRGRIRAIGRVIHVGRRLYFAAGELIDKDGTTIATAQGTFKRTQVEFGDRSFVPRSVPTESGRATMPTSAQSSSSAVMASGADGDP